MSRINDLIKELCPNGVSFKKLKEMGETFTGLSGKSKADFVGGNARFITYTNIYNNPAVRLDLDDKVVIKENENQNVLKYGDILIAGSSENLEDSGMVSVVCEEPTEKVYINSFCFGYRLNDEYKFKLIPGFLKHIFRSDNFRSQIITCSFGVTRYNLNKKKFLDLTLPLPPIEMQEEIVRILDKFGELEVKLEVELEVRKNQYEFWRRQMFNHKGNTKISDIFTRVKGTSITAGKMKEIEDPGGKIRIFAGGQTAVNANLEDIPKANIIDYPCVIVQSRGLIDFVYYDKPFTFKNEMWAYTCDNQVTVKYLYYYLKNNVNYFREIGTQMGSMPQISLPVTEKFEIYLPALEEQKKIVNILDKFEKLISDISIGLPAEIELRRQQYEYYRNKLLSFEEVNVSE